MVTISAAVRQVKDDLPNFLEPHIEQALQAHSDYAWRDRVLGPLATLLLLVRQIMHGNTAITHLHHLSDLTFTAAAYCKARQRLPLALVQRVSQRIARQGRFGVRS